jgi:phenylalanine-4-hydroxylase
MVLVYYLPLKRMVYDGWSTKLPYSIDAAHANFDITKPQQLYVTPNFAYLNLVLEEFANKMALRTGGLSGIEN